MPDAIGQPLDRIVGPLKVTGRAVYTAEFNIADLTHAVLKVSPIAKGQIVSIDSAAAERVPGVVAILTHQNHLKLAKSPSLVEDSPADRVLQLLQDDRVLYANQPVAVAVAETLEAAQEAAALLQIRYRAETPSVRMDDRLGAAESPSKIQGGEDPGETSRGDVGRGLAEADAKIEHIYSTPFQTHNPMEPHATIAVWDSPSRLTLYDSSQGIFGDRKRVAGLLGLRVDDVRVISLYLGGGFGSKGPTWSHVMLCAMAARHINRPVKLVLERPQMFGPVGCRSTTRQNISAGAKRDGSLTALRNETTTQTSSFDTFIENATVPTRMLYATPNNSTVQRLVRSDIGTPSYMRAPGESTGSYALEVAMDELAVALDMDPLELRLKNDAGRDEDKNLPWSSKSLRECYRQGADRFGWSRRPRHPRAMREGNTLIGWGMATAAYPTKRSAASARAQLNESGTLLVEAGTQSLGGGTYTVMTQVAADALGVPVSRVVFRLGDTRYPQTPVSGGSQTAASTGSAVWVAVRALRDLILQMALGDRASPVHGAAADQIEIRDGRIFLRATPSRGETLQALVTRHGRPVESTAEATPGEAQRHYSMYAFGAQFAEVRVDADLGQLRVSRMVGVFDAGRILNAKTARSQFLGGMVWGVSFALYENTTYDAHLGRIVNNNFAEYLVPTNPDIGSIEVGWVNESDTIADPIGVKGIGEIGITGSAAAVANALYHATGKRVRDLPITLDKLL